MRDVLNAVQAAKVIGCGPQKVRERIKRGIWTWGRVVTAKEAGNLHNGYEVNLQELADWLHISREEVERRLEA